MGVFVGDNGRALISIQREDHWRVHYWTINSTLWRRRLPEQQILKIQCNRATILIRGSIEKRTLTWILSIGSKMTENEAFNFGVHYSVEISNSPCFHHAFRDLKIEKSMPNEMMKLTMFPAVPLDTTLEM